MSKGNTQKTVFKNFFSFLFRDANETVSVNVRDSDRGILKLEVTPASFVTVVFW